MPAVPRITKVVKDGYFLHFYLENVGDASLRLGHLKGKVHNRDGTVGVFLESLGAAEPEPGETAKASSRIFFDEKCDVKSIQIKEYEEHSAYGGAKYPINTTITLKRGFFGGLKIEVAGI